MLNYFQKKGAREGAFFYDNNTAIRVKQFPPTQIFPFSEG